MSKELQTLVYITGSGRSGSTLLDMLLSTHGDIAALGEAHRFSMNLGKTTAPFRCTCGETVEHCQFWSKVLDMLEKEKIDPCQLKTTWLENELIGENEDGTNIIEFVPETNIFHMKVNFFNLLLGLKLERLVKLLAPIVGNFKEGINISDNSWKLYELVCRANNKEIIIDGSKTPGRLLGLQAFNKKNYPIKVLYLCRDGRAVTHARMKRQGLSMKEAAQIWVTEHKKISIALNIHKGQLLKVKYEDLCIDPSKVLKKVYGFIGAKGVVEKVSFRDSSHSLGGNPMRLRKSERKIVLNDAWKGDLSQSELEIFEDIGGSLNRVLGYE